jgi:hypothetical protein
MKEINRKTLLVFMKREPEIGRVAIVIILLSFGLFIWKIVTLLLEELIVETLLLSIVYSGMLFIGYLLFTPKEHVLYQVEISEGQYKYYACLGNCYADLGECSEYRDLAINHQEYKQITLEQWEKIKGD